MMHDRQSIARLCRDRAAGYGALRRSSLTAIALDHAAELLEVEPITADAASDIAREQQRQPQAPGPHARVDGRSLMSGPHGGVEPPAILIVWSSAAGAWRATAVVAAELEPIEIEGPTSSHGSSPSAALDELLGRRFGILFDEQYAPTLIEVRQVDEPR